VRGSCRSSGRGRGAVTDGTDKENPSTSRHRAGSNGWSCAADNLFAAVALAAGEGSGSSADTPRA